jgi:nitrite reductase (NADH) small subunit/3-phenylpropionate/trans-cinnamate dioxygenase ferredoxin subunit
MPEPSREIKPFGLETPLLRLRKTHVSTWYPAAKIDQLPEGECLAVEAGGLTVALFNVKGAVYALDNTCPHAGGPLGEGFLSGLIIECPWHGWRYDVRTGERPENPEFRVACYEVKVEDGIINVRLPERRAGS